MRKLLLAAVAVMGMSGSAAAVDPGVYYCVTERMVGIQPEREAKEGEDPLDIPRFYGQIKPETEKFIVKIRPVDETMRKSWCERFEERTEGVFWMAADLYCSDAIKWVAVLPQRKNPWPSFGRPLVSHNPNFFNANGTTTFMILDNLDYVLFHLDVPRLGGTTHNYLEEGHCETFQE